MTRLITALEQREREAKGWKAIADSRLADLVTISTQVKELEMYVTKQRSLPWVLSEAPITLHEDIRDGPSVRAGVSAVEEVFDQIKAITAAFHATTMEGVDIVTEATSRLCEGVGMPDMSELEECEGLSLAEMGGHHREVPPSPPRSVSIPDTGADRAQPAKAAPPNKEKTPTKAIPPKGTKEMKAEKDKKKK